MAVLLAVVGNLLKPQLARGELRCIGATTLDEYRKYIEKDPALERRFQQVWVGWGARTLCVGWGMGHSAGTTPRWGGDPGGGVPWRHASLWSSPVQVTVCWAWCVAC
jgi:hypothetical protein